MANLNLNVVGRRVVAFLNQVELSGFKSDDDDKLIQVRRISCLKERIDKFKFNDSFELEEFFEFEEEDCNSSGMGLMAEVALACRAFVAMNNEIRQARESEGRYKYFHTTRSRQWRESIRYSGFLGWF